MDSGIDWARWGTDLLRVLIWPGLAIAAVWVTWRSQRIRSSIARLLEQLIDKLSSAQLPGGVKFDFTNASALQVTAETTRLFDGLTESVNDQYREQVRSRDIHNTFGSLVAEVIAPVMSDRQLANQYRTTIHIRDSLFQETLLQLLDYLPNGSGFGRRFPVRRGIIGLAWRTGQHEIRNQVPLQATELIRGWGMTAAEASRAGSGRQSFAAVVLRTREGQQAGILYIDANSEGAFGAENEQTEFITALVNASQGAELAEKLYVLDQEMRRAVPTIPMYS